MEPYIIRTVARTPERAGHIARAALIVRGALVPLMLIILAIYGHVAHLNATITTAAYIMAITTALGSFSAVLLAVFQGNEQMSYGTVGGIILNCLDLGLILLVIAFHGGVVAFAATTVLGNAVILAFYVRLAPRYVRLSGRVSRNDVREVISGGMAFWANSVFLTFYSYGDSVILGSLAGPKAVGIYTPPMRMYGVACFFPSIIGTVTWPML